MTAEELEAVPADARGSRRRRRPAARFILRRRALTERAPACVPMRGRGRRRMLRDVQAAARHAARSPRSAAGFRGEPRLAAKRKWK